MTVALLCAFAASVRGQDAIATGSLTSTTCPGTGCVILSIANRGSGTIQLTGTFTATVQFEGSVDGANWFAIPAATIAASPATVTSATATGRWTFTPGGYAAVRVRASAFTSGPI